MGHKGIWGQNSHDMFKDLHSNSKEVLSEAKYDEIKTDLHSSSGIQMWSNWAKGSLVRSHQPHRRIFADRFSFHYGAMPGNSHFIFFFFLMYVSETLSAVIQKGGKIHRLCQDLFSPFSVDPFKLSCVVYLSIKLPFSSWLSISGSYNHTHHCWDFGTQGIILLQETTES